MPERVRGEVETTDGESAFTREFLPGLRDGGSVTLEGRHDPDDAGQEALEDNWEADQDVETIFITLPTRARTSLTSKVRADVFVTAWSVDLPQEADEAATFSCTLKVADEVTKHEA